MLVYTQTAPDVPDVAQRIERLGRDLTAFTNRNTTDVTGGHGMDIALDTRGGVAVGLVLPRPAEDHPLHAGAP